MIQTKPPEERFWPKVQITPGCWLWTGDSHPRGYGVLYTLCTQRERKKVGAHRFSYELHNGPIPEGLVVRHKCDNPPCVNPDHLEVGTNADNVRDMVERGRVARGEMVGLARLTERQVTEIRASSDTQRVLAKRFDVTQAAISYIKNRKRWGHVA